jgi:NADH-quinone oxidoreductase subunit G
MAAAEDKLSVTVTVDGHTLEAAPGEMLIQVTDRAGIQIPRFCYHDKLSIAANCRMCLVEVERAPKPLPACATPVMDGMVVRTRSERAVGAQKATMEFLLINHPLDCPICDQGGECELQDQAMGYGRDISRYTERKRVVRDKDIGPLVSTDMTRCIHCTRCVRFGEEIAGFQELGTIGRGEDMRIGTFIEQSVDHELSGNIIDLCPVGALNNKPFRFRARAWELQSVAGVSAHDCFGSNTWNHVQRGEDVLRIVPRDDERLNEGWLADRDRFACEGIHAEDRVTVPMVREGEDWREIHWEEALVLAAESLKTNAGDDLGILLSPSSTCEEMLLASKLASGLGCNNIDHRVRRADQRDQAADPQVPGLGLSPAELEQMNSVLVVACNMRREVPMYAHRLGNLGRAGGELSFCNAREVEWLHPIHATLTTGQRGLASGLRAILEAACKITGTKCPKHLKGMKPAKAADEHKRIAQSLVDGERALVMLGLAACRNAAYSDLRALAAALAEITGARFGELTEGANTAGGYLAGAVPHRGIAGAESTLGLDARTMLEQARPGYLLVGLEPEFDSICGGVAQEAMDEASCVILVAPYLSERMREYVSVFLPTGTAFESSGTFINASGDWQSFRGAMQPMGASRPTWKVLRVLGNMLEFDGFEHDSSEEVLAELELACADIDMDQTYRGAFEASSNDTEGMIRVSSVPLYACDMLARRSQPLQDTVAGRMIAVRMSPADATKLGVGSGHVVAVTSAEGQVTMDLSVDPGVKDGDVWVPVGVAETLGLSGCDVPVEVTPL